MNEKALLHLKGALASMQRNEKLMIQALTAKGYPCNWLYGVRRGMQHAIEAIENEVENSGSDLSTLSAKSPVNLLENEKGNRP